MNVLLHEYFVSFSNCWPHAYQHRNICSRNKDTPAKSSSVLKCQRKSQTESLRETFGISPISQRLMSLQASTLPLRRHLAASVRFPWFLELPISTAENAQNRAQLNQEEVAAEQYLFISRRLSIASLDSRFCGVVCLVDRGDEVYFVEGGLSSRDRCTVGKAH